MYVSIFRLDGGMWSTDYGLVYMDGRELIVKSTVNEVCLRLVVVFPVCSLFSYFLWVEMCEVIVGG